MQDLQRQKNGHGNRRDHKNEGMLEEKFQRYIREHALVEPGDRILLTVSGGVDSWS